MRKLFPGAVLGLALVIVTSGMAPQPPKRLAPTTAYDWWQGICWVIGVCQSPVPQPIQDPKPKPLAPEGPECGTFVGPCA